MRKKYHKINYFFELYLSFFERVIYLSWFLKIFDSELFVYMPNNYLCQKYVEWCLILSGNINRWSISMDIYFLNCISVEIIKCSFAINAMNLGALHYKHYSISFFYIFVLNRPINHSWLFIIYSLWSNCYTSLILESNDAKKNITSDLVMFQTFNSKHTLYLSRYETKISKIKK